MTPAPLATGELLVLLLTCIIPGTPQQQGSKRNVGGNRFIEANKNLATWRADARRRPRALSSSTTLPKCLSSRRPERISSPMMIAPNAGVESAAMVSSPR